MKLYLAPLEGITGYIYRNAYNKFFGQEIDKYFTPFIVPTMNYCFTSKELNDTFKKCSNAFKENGIMYASFKYGIFEGERHGRYFLDLNEESIKKHLKGLWISNIKSK